MSSEEELTAVLKELETFQSEITSADEEEAIINSQIASLKLRIYEIKDKRKQSRTKVYAATAAKESLERKIELERETKVINDNLESRRQNAMLAIADAPWKDEAFPWQIDGMIQLPERALLGDKRGMGKTLSALIWRRINGAKRTLVCLKRELAVAFIKEIERYEPGLFVYPMLGAKQEERDVAAFLLNTQKEFIVVTNIESWRRNIDDVTEAILKIDYDAVILDEAHNIKNFGTGTAQGFLRLSQAIPKVLELTGTPIKNRPQELFTLLHSLYPEMFPKERLFLFDYCTRVDQNKWVFTPQGVVNLVKKISPFFLARGREDVGSALPPPDVKEYKLNFDNHPEQKKAYQLMTERSMAMLSTGKVIPIVSQLAIMTRQAQTVSWPAGIKFNYFNPDTGLTEVVEFDVHQSVKMDWAEDFIQQLVEEGERVVFFSRFKPAVYELRDRLIKAGLSVAVITGDEKGDHKEIFDDFDLKTAHPTDYKYQVLLATYQTVGESANFNAAAHMVTYDEFWNPGNQDQAYGRIDRINSVRQATIHVPRVENSIDEYMAELIDEKRTMIMGFKSETDQQASLREHLRKSL